MITPPDQVSNFQHDRLEALFEISQALNSSLELETALNTVVEAAIRLTGAERGYLMLFDERTGQLRFQAARGLLDERLDEAAFEVSRSVVYEVARTGEPVVTLNAQKDPRFNDKASIANFLLRSIMAVPLRVQGRMLGTLYVDNKTRDINFGKSDLALLETFADQAATAIINAQLYEAQKREAELKQILLEVAQMAQAKTTVAEFAQALLRVLPSWTGCEGAVFLVHEAESDSFRVLALDRVTRAAQLPATAILPFDQVPFLQTLRFSREPLHLLAEQASGALTEDWHQFLGLGDLLLIPVQTADELLAVVVLGLPKQPLQPLAHALAESLIIPLGTSLQRLRLLETSQRQLSELSVLNATALAASEAQTSESLAQSVLQVLQPVLQADYLWLSLATSGKPLETFAFPNGEKPYLPETQNQLAQSVLKTGQLQHLPSQEMAVPDTGQLSMHTWLAVPLKVKEHVSGVLTVASSQQAAFTQADERLLSTLASQLATAVEKQRLLETQREQRELAEALRDIGLALTLETNLATMLGQLLEHVQRVIPYDAACVMLYQQGVMQTISQRGYDRYGQEVVKYLHTRRLVVAETPFLQKMAETGNAVWVADVLAEPGWRTALDSQYLRSWLGTPVFVQGQCVAFIALNKEAPNFFDAEHARRLTAFAGSAALAFRNSSLFYAQARRAAELDAVRTASLSLTSSLNIYEVLHGILQATLTLLPEAQDAVIYLYQAGRLTFGAAQRADGQMVDNLPAPRDNGLTYSIARSGEALVIPSTRQHPLFEGVTELWSEAILGVPLKIGVRIVGVMNVSYAVARATLEADLHIVRLLGDQAAIAIENASLFDAVRHQVEELTILHALAIGATESASANDLIELATKLVGQTLTADHYGVWLLNSSGTLLQPHPTYYQPARTSVSVVRGGLGEVVQTGRPRRIADLATDPASLNINPSLRSELSVPLKIRERIVGVFSAEAKRPGAFSENDERLLSTVAGQLAVALERMQLQEAEREQRELAEALREAANVLSASLDFNTVLDRLLDQITRVVPYDSASVMLVEMATQRVRVVRSRGYEKFNPEAVDTLNAKVLELTPRPHLKRLVETLEPVILADVPASPGWLPSSGTEHVRSWLGAPIMAQGRALVIFSLDKAETGFYQPKHAERLKAFGGQAALALQNARLFETEKRRVASLTSLHDIGLRLSAELDLDSLFETIVSTGVRLLETHMGAFYTQSATGFDLRVAHNLPQYFQMAEHNLGVELAASAAESRQPVILGDFLPEVETAHTSARVRSVLGAPIQWQGTLHGVLLLLDERPFYFGNADVDIVRLFADRVAASLENARLITAVGHEKQNLELLFELSQSLVATLSPHEVAERALSLICATTGATCGALYSPDYDRQELYPIQVHGYPDAESAFRNRLHFGQGIVGHAAYTRAVVACPDTRVNKHWVQLPNMDEGLLSGLALPLLAGDELVGVMSFSSDRVHFYQDDQLTLLQAATLPVALALQNARLFEGEASRVHYLTLLNEITQMALTVEKLTPLLQGMTERLGELTGATACLITQWDEARQQATPTTVYWPERKPEEKWDDVWPNAESLTEAVLYASYTFVIENSAISSYTARLLNPRTQQAFLVMPLFASGQRLGAAIVAYAQPRRFTREEMQNAEQAAGQIALAVARAKLFLTTQQHVEELGVASDLLHTLSISPETLTDFGDLAEGLQSLTGCRIITLSLLSDDGQALQVVRTSEPDYAWPVNARLPLTEISIAPEALSGRVVFTTDLTTTGFELDQKLVEAGYRSRMTLPLRGSHGILGALDLLWRDVRGFVSVNLTLINQVADALALALEKERLLKETLKRAAELEAIDSVALALRAAASTQEALKIMVERTAALFQADSANVVLPDATSSHLYVAEQLGMPGDTPQLTLDIDNSIAGLVFRTGQAYRTNDMFNDPNADPHSVKAWQDTLPQGRAIMSAPLKLGSVVTGVLGVSAPAPHVFSDGDARLLSAIAALGGNALQRAQVLETLEQRVEERTQELAKANEQLQELDKLKDMFVSNVSHELRTPLTAIKLHLGLLNKRGAELLPRYLPVLVRETDRLHRLIEDLLDLSRIRTQPKALKRAWHTLDTLVDEVIVLQSSRADERGVNLQHHPNASVPMVWVDASQMMQVLNNLISNAVLYTASGGQITVSSQLFSSGEMEGVQLRVHNDGPIIPEEDLPHLFTRFYRGQIGQQSGESGTGLGLSISKEIIERHGGDIRVTSAEAEGTTFSVWLPLTSEPTHGQ